MIGQMNEHKKLWQHGPPEHYGSFTRPSLAIPRQVASPDPASQCARPDSASPGTSSIEQISVIGTLKKHESGP
jgi:hypothetical protein